jgi:TRAP-type mannitol/chloroaromatic compound transport system permease small subunit
MTPQAQIDAIEVQARIESHAHGGRLPHTRLSRTIDEAIRRIGDVVSWVWVALLAVVVTNVVLRYAFGEGRIEFEELQWHLYSVGFLTGLSYCVASDDHIRVDFLHDRFSPRLQAWVELYGITLLLLPFITLMLVYCVPFIAHSLSIGEVSAAPGGLPYRWAIKSTLFAGFALLATAAFSRLLRVCSALFSVPTPLAEPSDPSSPRRGDA